MAWCWNSSRTLAMKSYPTIPIYSTLILSLQDAFGIQFDTNEISFENFRTVSDIAELINRKSVT
jgi:hypothetical protein